MRFSEIESSVVQPPARRTDYASGCLALVVTLFVLMVSPVICCGGCVYLVGDAGRVASTPNPSPAAAADTETKKREEQANDQVEESPAAAPFEVPTSIPKIDIPRVEREPEPKKSPTAPTPPVDPAPMKPMRELREWRSGEYTTKAVMVSFAGGKVRLRKEDGKEVTVHYEDLSLPDQLYVDSILGRN